MPTTRNSIPSVKLQEIADWQLDPAAFTNDLRVDLPKLQRGFVWEPKRIINLWDSLLRGFPIGSLLLSEIGDKDSPENQSGQYWLLDGQQRVTSIAMGFYNPWEGHAYLADNTEKQGWSLKVIPVLWIDILPEKSKDEEKLFFPFLVTQSHPWGYRQSGEVLPWGDRQRALQIFIGTAAAAPYTSLALKNAFPWEANLPVPLAFLIKCAGIKPCSEAQFKESLLSQCRLLPEAWQSRFGSKLSGLSEHNLTSLLEACLSLNDCSVHLNYLNLRTRGNDGVDRNDNSILFVRLNTGGKQLGGEELIFSLFKSEFPAAKDAVEKAAAGFMPPSRLFSLLVRLVSAGDDSSKLHVLLTLRDFKAKITDSKFKGALEAFISDRVAETVATARDLLTGKSAYSLPPALATRTINEAPDVFLALLHWLCRGGKVSFESPEHRSLLAAITALAWFAPGNARQKQENLRQWMQVAHTRPIGEFWNPQTIRTLFSRSENPLPSFPDPILIQDFLEKTIVNDPKYIWENLGAMCPKHPIFSGYSHISIPDEAPPDVEPNTPPHLLRENVLQENLRRFIKILSGSTHLLLFAQRVFIEREFRDFQQWDIVLEDTTSPWDWDHIYPSAHRKRYVDSRYRDWHNTIGNKRAEELSRNRRNGSSDPNNKLGEEKTREDSFISEEVWEMIQGVSPNITDPATANTLCEIILRRMVEIYREWHTTLGIGQLME